MAGFFSTLLGGVDYTTQIYLGNLEERISKLENRLFRTDKKSLATLSQKILMFDELGLLSVINKLKMPDIKKAKLLSVLMDCSKDNLKKALTSLGSKDSKIKNSLNYEFVRGIFKEVGLEKEAEKIEIELIAIRKKEELKNKKK